METNLIKQKFTAPAVANTVAPVSKKPTEKSENNPEAKKLGMSGATKLGLSLVGLAVLGTASYLIFRGKSKAIEKPLDKAFDELREIVKDFKPHYEDATKKIETVLKDGRTKITYSGVNKGGAEVREIIVLNKDKSIMRVLQEKNKNTGEFVSNTFKGDKDVVLQSFADIPEANVFKTLERDALIPEHNGLSNWMRISTDNYSRTNSNMYDKDGKFVSKLSHLNTSAGVKIKREYNIFAYEKDKMVGNLIETNIPAIGSAPEKILPKKFILNGKPQAVIPNTASDKRFDRYFDAITGIH